MKLIYAGVEWNTEPPIDANHGDIFLVRDRDIRGPRSIRAVQIDCDVGAQHKASIYITGSECNCDFTDFRNYDWGPRVFRFQE